MTYKWFILFCLPAFIWIASSVVKSEDPKEILWGFYGHKRINRVAVFNLPPEMFGFYKEHIEFLTEHSVDPDKRRYAVEGEAQRHYIDLDHFYIKGKDDPFEIMPKKWEDAVNKYTEDTLQAYGIVPWHIQTMKFRLQKAFETKNGGSAVKSSFVLLSKLAFG